MLDAIPFEDFLGSLSLPCAERDVEHVSDQEQSRMRTFLAKRYGNARPVLTRVDENGLLHDYFPVEDQPASRHSPVPASPPPCEAISAGETGLQFRDNSGGELAGLVPIRRYTASELARFSTLDEFLSKRTRKRRSHLRAPEAVALAVADPTHRWADAYQQTASTGACSTLNIWQPALQAGQFFSLSQIWCLSVGSGGRQTAEIGWHVDPAVTGHNYPAIFCYWTFDGYRSPTSYNGAGGDFHFNGSNTVLGMPIKQVSVVGGAQVEVTCALRLFQGNWWLYVGGDQPQNAIGYFPAALYQGGPLPSGAGEVDFGGEVCGGPPFGVMGSGAPAASGYRQAAYQRNLGVYGTDGKLSSPSMLQTDEASPDEYSILNGNSGTWGSYFYYGGGGGA